MEILNQDQTKIANRCGLHNSESSGYNNFAGDFPPDDSQGNTCNSIYSN